jgi:hypothetical protein
MELIEAYTEIDLPRRVDLRYPDFRPEWSTFHNSTEHKISVFAGRQMGKTYNLVLRAVRSQYDCVIFTKHTAMVKVIREKIKEMSHELDMTRNAGGQCEAHIEYVNGRRIDIYAISRSTNHRWRGRRLHMKEVLIDEFENNFFYDILDEIRGELSRAAHIVCVGSINTPYDSRAKRWFQSSGTKYYLDSHNAPSPYTDHYRQEFFPSEMRHLIEHLPPLDSEF